MLKKRIVKSDGRYLIYYHFPESATDLQGAVFAEIDELKPDGGMPATLKEDADGV